MRVSYGWSMIFMFFLTGVSASGIADPVKDLMLIDTIYLPGETVCFEERDGLYFDECGVYVPTNSGSHLLCCEKQDNSGSKFILCKEYTIGERMREGYELIVLCDDEKFELPFGDSVDCGQHLRVNLKSTIPDGCDSSTLYDVNKIVPTVIIDGPLCREGEPFLRANVYFECNRNPDQSSVWIEKESGSVLASGTDYLNINDPGQYCYVVETAYQGEVCLPKQFCITVPDLKLAAAQFTGGKVRCRDTTIFVAYNYFQDRSSFEWTASEGEFIGETDTNRVRLDLSKSKADTVEVCVQYTNECGPSSPHCIRVTFDPDSVAGDFSFRVNGDTVFFTSNVQGANRYFWDLGSRFSTEKNPWIIFNKEGDYEIRLIASNRCAADTIDRIVTIRTTAVFNPEVSEQLKVFPNPSTGRVTIKMNEPGRLSERLRIRVLSFSGQQVYSTETTSTELLSGMTLDLLNVVGGIYYLLVEGDEAVYIVRLVVTR